MYENEEGFGIKVNLIKFLRNWPVFLISLLITLSAGFIFLKLFPKQYQTTAAILIKDQKKGTEDAQMVQSLNQLAANKIVENEIEVLRSKELL
ncbi:MAG: Wzz/FepE/Etk N-terminal domain-containing protein, partial [Flavihumibacter sp.]|nr:Wzz/FepE/Etk N-terminal domain-containing protein [Flavihumibacter sp.]